MTDNTHTAPAGGELTPIKQALLEIRTLRARLAETETAQREPVAIVGMACRFPGGVRTPGQLWELLREGKDAIVEIPPDRWPADEFYDPDPETPGKMNTKWGGLLDGVDQFDPHFFGISPKEAVAMDPQQRLLLEVSWEALERAGQPADRLVGSPTGVFVGIGTNDYFLLQLRTLTREEIDPYLVTGASHSVASGRLSFFYGFQGPSVSIDTACSSSLVAVHLALQSLRRGECRMALVGGSNLMLVPELNINFSRARMMAADGHCKTFDAAADGYVRGEGCAVIVLKRLSHALEDGDRVLAVVRGSAVNQDGRSSGLTVPNGTAQEALIRSALDEAGVSPLEVGYVEAHGTGTSLGDPIEVHALGNVYCAARDAAQPLLLGSIKTNIGHLEATAGLAGLLKVVLALGAQTLPAHRNFHSPNPLIAWDRYALRIPLTAESWKPIGGRRIGAVSSFGFSGTNAHVILEEAPAATVQAATPERPLHVLALSARDPRALTEVCRHSVESLGSHPTVSAADYCYSANTGRVHFSFRTAVVGSSREEMLAALQSRPARPAAEENRDEAVPARPTVAFLFTGQGSQYAGMGKSLYATSPVFRATIERCDGAMKPLLGRSVTELLFGGAPVDFQVPLVGHAALFAVQVALASLWESWGIVPAYVLGHSLGEYAAAVSAGVLRLEDAAHLILERGRLIGALKNEGGMLSLRTGPDTAAELLQESGGRATLAAVNGPTDVVISGPTQVLDAIASRCAERGIETRRLELARAFHSPAMAGAAAELEKIARGRSFAPPQVTFLSTVTGGHVETADLCSSAYWARQITQPVRFMEAMQLLDREGATHCIEMGPHPVLCGIGARVLPDRAMHWLPSLRRGDDEWLTLLRSLAEAYESGLPVEWAGFDRGYARARVDVPTYPFQRSRYWLNVSGASRTAAQDDRWEEAVKQGRRQAGFVPADLPVSDYAAKWTTAEAFVVRTVDAVLRNLGAPPMLGGKASPEAIIAATGIAPGYAGLVGRWLRRLRETTALSDAEKQALAGARGNREALTAASAAFDRAFADNPQLHAYIRHCAGLVADVLTGKVSPLETLFPGGDFVMAEELYAHSATMRYVNALAAETVRAFAGHGSGGSALRILEVGAGTGGTTGAILQSLRADAVEYYFTDTSDAFLARARSRFAHYPFLRFGRLDVEGDFAQAGFPEGSVNAIVGANVVHATKDVRACLRSLRTALAPGGMLVLVESTTDFAWFDITTWLIEGWRAFDDGIRNASPLLTAGAWSSVLHESGFDAVECLPGEGSPAAVLGQHVIIARAPGHGVARPVSMPSMADAETPRAPESLSPTSEFLASLRRVFPADRQELMVGFVRERVMKTLGLDEAHRPDRHGRLMSMGVDSLMAVQLRNLLGRDLGLGKSVTATLIYDYPSIEDIARHLLSLLDLGREKEPVPPAPLGPSQGEAEMATLSDEEVEQMLRNKLDGKQRTD